jgi:hypothetical protein
MCRDWLKNSSTTTNRDVTVANNQKLQTEGSGDVVVQIKQGGQEKTITNVMHVPGVLTNLSVSRFVGKGLVVISSKEDVRSTTGMSAKFLKM